MYRPHCLSASGLSHQCEIKLKSITFCPIESFHFPRMDSGTLRQVVNEPLTAHLNQCIRRYGMFAVDLLAITLIQRRFTRYDTQSRVRR